MFQDLETIRITQQGAWLSNGEPITHRETLRGFKRHLGHDDQGYFIQIGPDFKRIEVEDTAYFVEQIFIFKSHIELRLSDESHEFLDLQTLSYSPSRLICQIKGGKLPAKFLPQPYHELLLQCEVEGAHHVLKFGNAKVSLD
jgi:hypothetical protein